MDPESPFNRMASGDGHGRATASARPGLLRGRTGRLLVRSCRRAELWIAGFPGRSHAAGEVQLWPDLHQHMTVDPLPQLFIANRLAEDVLVHPQQRVVTVQVNVRFGFHINRWDSSTTPRSGPLSSSSVAATRAGRFGRARYTTRSVSAFPSTDSAYRRRSLIRKATILAAESTRSTRKPGCHSYGTSLTMTAS
jgi:hypothetical protein